MENMKTFEAATPDALHAATNSYTAARGRTTSEIGSRHVDNSRGELKKLEAPAVVQAREYVIQLRSKTLGMIDALIAHLEASRKKLSEDEMLANEHFADFQAQMIKENHYLEEKIAEANRLLLSLNVQLKKAQAQHARREALRREAEENLKALRKQCAEKEAYFKRETARRANELSITASALATYNKIVASVQARIASRVSSNFSGAKSYKSTDINENNVANYQGSVHSSVSSNVKSRNEVVL
jgi:hypothetical protein